MLHSGNKKIDREKCIAAKDELSWERFKFNKGEQRAIFIISLCILIGSIVLLFFNIPEEVFFIAQIIALSFMGSYFIDCEEAIDNLCVEDNFIDRFDYVSGKKIFNVLKTNFDTYMRLLQIVMSVLRIGFVWKAVYETHGVLKLILLAIDIAISSIIILGGFVAARDSMRKFKFLKEKLAYFEKCYALSKIFPED